MDQRPNILWFVADQMRRDAMHHAGNPAAITPHLDEMAVEGVSFENAFCQNPVCVPSRCSFLTGHYPHTSGHRTMHYLQREDEPNILKTMKENGYEVIWIGRNDVVPGDREKTAYCDQFFDGTDLEEKSSSVGNDLLFKGISPNQDVTPEVMPVMQGADLKYSFYQGRYPEHSLDHTFDWNAVNCALNYIRNRAESTSEKPFFIYCTLTFPHPPYGCEEPWYSLIDRGALPPRRPDIETLKNKAEMLYAIREKQGMKNWTEEQYDEIRAVYLGMTARFDHQLGLLVKELKKSGFYDNTAVFVFSDHGDYTCDYGIAEKCQNSFEDTLTNVPLLVKLPEGMEMKTGINNALVQLNDLPVTICELAGIDIGYRQFGKSLCKTLKSGEAHRDAVFCEGGRLKGEKQAMEPEHPVSSPYWPRISTQHESISAHGKGCMIRTENMKYVMRLYAEDELYDLEKDPMETRNVIHCEEYRDKLQEMKSRMLEFYMETSDFVPEKMDKR